MWETEQLWGTIDFLSQCYSSCLAKNFLQNISLCVQQNKEMYTLLEQLEGE